MKLEVGEKDLLALKRIRQNYDGSLESVFTTAGSSEPVLTKFNGCNERKLVESLFVAVLGIHDHFPIKEEGVEETVKARKEQFLILIDKDIKRISSDINKERKNFLSSLYKEV